MHKKQIVKRGFKKKDSYTSVQIFAQIFLKVGGTSKIEIDRQTDLPSPTTEFSYFCKIYFWEKVCTAESICNCYNYKIGLDVQWV